MASEIFVALRANISEFSAKMGEARAEMAKLNHEGASHMSSVASVGKAAFLGLGAAAVAGGVMSLKSAMTFQESMTQLRTGAGESERNMKLVSDGMLHMAGQVGISAQDLAKGMFLVESAGYHGADGLKVLRAAAEGARVGGASMTTMADGLTTVLNAYHMSAGRAATVTSQLVATVSLGKIHMEDLASSLGVITPIAAALHVPFTQAAAAIATMSAQGTDAHTSTTSLRFLLASMAGPTSAAAKEFKALGVSQSEIPGITLKTTDALKAMGLHTSEVADTLTHKGLPAALQLITDAIGKKFPVGSAAYVAALRGAVGGTRGMTAALELTGKNMETYTGSVTKLGTVHAEAGNHVLYFGLTQKDLKTQVENAKYAVEAFSISVGLKLIPLVQSAIKWIQEHVTVVKALAVVIGTVLLAAITAWVGGLVWAAGASVVNFGKMIFLGEEFAATQEAGFARSIAAGVRWVAALTAQVAVAIAKGALWVAATAAQGVIWLAGQTARLAVFLAQQAAAGAVWIATWAAQGAIMVAGAAATGAVWLAENAMRLAAFVAANTIAALESYAPWVLQFNRMIVRSAAAGATWLAENAVRLATYVASNVAAAATWVAGWVASWLAMATGSSTAGAGWLASNTARLVAFVSSNVAAAASWVATWVAQGAAMVASAVATGAIWLATNSAHLAVFIARNVAAAAVYLATWVATNAAMLASAIATGIGVVIAMGPILLVVAAVGFAAYELYKHWDTVWGFLKGLFNDGVKFVKDHLDWFALAIGPIGVAAYLLYKNWSTVWNGIKTVMSDVWGFIKPIIDGITAGVASVSSAISTLSSAASAVKGVIGSVSSALTNPGKALHIPGFATGVENFAGGLALVGERGPEVVRLPQGSSVYPHGTGPGGGQTVNITGPHIEIHGNLDNVSLRDLHSHLDEWAHSLVTEIQSGRR